MSAALSAEVDGVSESASQAIYQVRIDGGEVCLAGVTAAITPERQAGKPAASPSTPAPAPATFVRADLAGKRAEGGERGVPPAASTRRMTCSLSPRK